MSGGRYCYLHNPKIPKAEKRKAQSRGGQVTVLDKTNLLDPVDITDARTVIYILADTINRVRKVQADGSMDVKTANCIGHLASKMLEAQRVVAIEERIEKIERVVLESQKNHDGEQADRVIDEILDGVSVI